MTLQTIMIFKPVIDFILTLLMAILAFVGLYIAWQQRKINELRLKRELFDKRYEIYNSTATIIADVLTYGNLNKGDTMSFLRETKAASLLFDEDIVEFILSISRNVEIFEISYPEITTRESENIIRKKRESRERVQEQSSKLEETFSKYLKLNYY